MTPDTMVCMLGVNGLARLKKRLFWRLALIPIAIGVLVFGAFPMARLAKLRMRQPSSELIIPSTALLARSGHGWRAVDLSGDEVPDGQLGIQVWTTLVYADIDYLGTVPLFRVWSRSWRYESFADMLASSGRPVPASPIPRISSEDWGTIRAQLLSNAPPVSIEDAEILEAFDTPPLAGEEVRVSFVRLGLQILGSLLAWFVALSFLTVRFAWCARRFRMVVRQLTRFRAGRCVNCGYELGALSRCPECGGEVESPDAERVDKSKIARQ